MKEVAKHRQAAAVRFTAAFLFVALTLAFAVHTADSADRVFVHMLTTAPSVLDPAKSNRIDDDQVMWLIYDALTQLSADGARMIPALAERWEASPDDLTYTFTLRNNVRFHDGSLVDAEAVKASYERQFLKGSPFYNNVPPNAYENVMSRLVKSVRVIDSRTVEISTHYARPSQFALVKIVSPTALKKHGGDLSRTPVGTGPFRLARWEGKEVALSAFADSWHGRPKLDGVRFPAYEAPTEMVDSLIRGDSHLLAHLPPDYFEQFRGNPQVHLLKYGGLNVMYIGMVLDRPIFKDRRVREAIVRAVDRNRLATVLGRGAMIPAKGPLPPGCGGFDPEVSQPPYDNERARALLRDAGVSSPRLRLLYNSPSPVWLEIVQAVQADLAKVGVTVDLVSTSSWADFHTERKKNAHDLFFYNWAISTPDPDRLLPALFRSDSSDNYTRLANPRVDKLLDEAQKPMDLGPRLQLYSQVNRLVVDEIPAIFLVHRIGMAGVSNRVTGLTLNLYGLPQDKLSKVEIR
jgi:peptide/nickel transport system substrate-binding protein